MKTSGQIVVSLFIIPFMVIASDMPVRAAVMGTAFTYQGQLTRSGEPVSGTCNFTFKLYDALSGGSQVGATVTKTGITVTDGLFTTGLDFGSSAFSGDARWLQIAAKCGSELSYTTLSPRQELTPTPYAIHARSAIFENASGVVRNTGTHATDDFVFGSPQLADDGDFRHEARIFFDKSKGAFRAGRATGTEWDNAYLGSYSTAQGSNTTASGDWSTALGYTTTASGKFSTAMGYLTTAESYAETAIGIHNTDYMPASATDWNANDRLFVIGNGTYLAPSDALVMLKNGDTTLNGEFTAISTVPDDDAPAVSGEHAVTDFYGIGVQGKGGYIGVNGFVNPTGSERYYGVRGEVSGGNGTNYGVYGTAAGGIGNWAGYFKGNLGYTGALMDVSDLRLKEYIIPLEDAIDKVAALRGIYFNNKGSDQREVGVIAQEVEAVLPEAVKEDAEGYKYVSYPMLTPVLIEAVKELKAENDTLKAELAQQHAANEMLKAKLAQQQATLDLLMQRLATLEQVAQTPVASIANTERRLP